MKKGKNHCDLQSCSLCRQCLPEWLPAIESNRQTLHFKKGELIFGEGDELKGMYFVYEGSVKVHKKWGDEKELIVRFAKKGDIVGHRGLGKDASYPVSATALESVTVCFIDLSFFLTTLSVNHEFLLQLMFFFAEELKVSERKMRNLAHMPVKGRVAQAMLTLQEKFGTTAEGFLDLPVSRQDLASFVGTTYETFFRIINELMEERLLLANGKHFSILDAEGLRRYTQAG